MAPQPHGKLSQKQQQPLRFRSILRRVHSSHNDSTSVATEDATSHCEHDHSNSSERIIRSKKKTSHRHLRSVGWGNLTIYEFPTMLGDHPGVSDGGAPLTLAWNHEKRTVIRLDYQEYIRKHLHNIQQNQMGRRRPANRRMSNHAMIEQHLHDVEGHEPQSSRRRSAPVKRLDAGTRLSRLLHLGYTLPEIMKAVEEVDAIQQSRRATLMGIKGHGGGGLSRRLIFSRRASISSQFEDVLFSSTEKTLHASQFQTHRTTKVSSSSSSSSSTKPRIVASKSA